MINDIDATTARFDSPQREEQGDVRREVAALRGALIDADYRGAQLWPSGLHEKLNALFDAVDSGDRAPARQARDVYAALDAQVEELAARWSDICNRS